MIRPFFSVTCLIVAFGLAGCGTVGTDAANVDPWESYNRSMFKFNDAVDSTVFKPLAEGYTAILPDTVETGISNFFSNLMYPRTILNQALQGKFKLAVQDTGRFAFNTTAGLLGFVDMASKVGLEKHREDFGQTLGVWGLETGPYVVLPLLGSSSLRGTAGWLGDNLASPIGNINDNETRYSLMGLNIIQTRAGLLDAEKLITGDKYLFMRDAYLQRRAHEVQDAKPAEDDPFLSGEDE